MSNNFEGMSFGKAREMIRKTQDETEKNLSRERSKLDKAQDPWEFYAKDAEGYVQYFGEIFPDAAELPVRLEARHARGEKVLVVDVCGIADAKNIGADETIGFTLNRPQHIPETESLSIVEGDMFSTKGRNT